jgi:phage-related minor tail protein
VAGIYKGIFNGIAKAWNNTVGKISFEIPSWVPKIGGKGFSVPQIPMLAQGGIVNQATLAVIGEAGPEAVIPLDRMGDFGAGGGGINVTVNAGLMSSPDQVGQQIIEAIQKAQRRSGVVFAPA